MIAVGLAEGDAVVSSQRISPDQKTLLSECLDLAERLVSKKLVSSIRPQELRGWMLTRVDCPEADLMSDLPWLE